MTDMNAMPRPAWPAGRNSSGFWVVAFAFTITMAFTTVPTPLWTLYAQRDHFSSLTVTVVFAVYALAVALSLFLAGHLSDSYGRRCVLMPALALQIVVFVVWPSLPGLLLARVLSGLGIGAVTATATAWLSELRGADPRRTRTVAPETRPRISPRPRYRPQRVAVPSGVPRPVLRRRGRRCDHLLGLRTLDLPRARLSRANAARALARPRGRRLVCRVRHCRPHADADRVAHHPPTAHRGHPGAARRPWPVDDRGMARRPTSPSSWPATLSSAPARV
jgi:hypothetical protein